MIIDVHSHLQFPHYNKDRNEVIKRTIAENISTIIVGTDKKTSEEAVKLARKHDNFYAAVGRHPADNREEGFDYHFYESLAKDEKVVAIGECGIDLKEQNLNLKSQKQIFVQHIKLAKSLNKPLMIHCREAYDELIQIIREEKADLVGGNIHFFAGDIEAAEKFLAFGFYFSFTGVITFADQYDEVIRFLPPDKIMAETDSPFVSPAPYRKQRNEPIYVKETIKRLSQIKNIPYEEMAKITFENAKKLFNIK